MKKKTFIVQLLNSKKPSRTSFTQVEDANFYSNDTDASLVFIPHEDAFNFQSAKVVMFNRSDESLVERDMVVTTEDGRKVASYELPDEIISHWGQWIAQPVFINDDEIYSGAIVPFSVDRHLMHERPPKLTEVVTVTKFVQQSQELVNAMIQAEAQRITEEQVRQDSETNRVQAESERTTWFGTTKPQVEESITKSAEALTKSQNALSVANGIDAKATNALDLSESADTLSKSVQEQFNQVVIDGDSSVEAAQARVDAKGQTNETLKARLDKEHNEVTSQLAQTKYLGEYINRRIHSSELVKIKLIGDSKLAGLKTTGYEIPANGTVILTDPINGTVHRESSINGNGWAHRFERYLNAHFPNVTIDRWGIGGTSTKWWNDRIRSVTDKEDIVIVDLGTNDRYELTGVDGFRSDLISFLEYMESISNQVIVMVPSPATTESDVGKVFSQQEVIQVVKEVASEMQLPLIYNYDNVMDYVFKASVPFSELMADGTHPNDYGQEVIWRGVQSALTLYDFNDFVDVNSLDKRVVRYAEPNAYIPSDLPEKFKKGHIYVNLVYGGSATSSIPGTGVRSGIMVTDMSYGESGYAHQDYHLYNMNIVYRRFWELDESWSAWTQIATINPQENLALTVGTITANGTKEIVLSPTQAVNVNNLPILNVVSNDFAQGIMYNYWFNTTTNKIVLRFHNTTTSDVNINLVSVRLTQVISNVR